MRTRLLFEVLAVLVVGARLDAVVISEIHYNPPAGEADLEFVELANDTSTPEDISGYEFSEGISFVVPAGTILDAHARLVVCASAAVVRVRYGIDNVLGDFEGRLDSGGERLTLVDQVGVVVQSVRYRDSGKWPVGPDGTGHTLSLLDVHLDTSEPESWARSRELGGTPGLDNFPFVEPVFEDTVIIELGAQWRYRKGTAAFSSPEDAWSEPGFDDADWAVGPSGFGYGDDDDATVLEDMRGAYSSVACRARFDASAGDLVAPGTWELPVDFDDGFCAFINGVEFGGVNCPSGAAWDDSADGSREAGEEIFLRIPAEHLVVGENVLAVVGFNFSLTSSDFSLAPRLLRRRRVDDEVVDSKQLLLSELYRGSVAGEGWVEIHNVGAAPVDLGDLTLTDDPDRGDPHRFAAGTVIEPGGYLVVDEASTSLELSAESARLFLFDADGRVVTAAAFDRPPPPGSALGDYSEVRASGPEKTVWVTLTPTPGLANRVERMTTVVINEIFYHPPEDRPGEFLELFNRGDEAVDMSGFRFSKGIDYTFGDGVVIPAGGYLVVAEDPELLAEEYGFPDALGPYAGALADGGENIRLVDRAGNLVDEVRYHDGGRWALWADGRGSSLELIDSSQDNDVALAWDASDESEKAEWEELSFFVPDYVPAAETELHLFMAERAVCHVDDVSIVADAGGANFVPNSGFESGTSPWRIQGTHVYSERITTDSRSGAACLRIEASGKGDSLCNRVETDTQPRLGRGAYDVSLWARWIRGSSLLIAHGEFTAGPWPGRPGPAVNLSGNTLAARLRLAVPWNLGTPGEENSTTRRLLDETGTGNLGPVIADVAHDPVSPSTGVPVNVRARVTDSSGVERVSVFFREDDAEGVFDEATLHDDGVHDDGDKADGVWSGLIPGMSSRARVVFYIEAVDDLGAVRRFPVDAPEHTALFQVNGSMSAGLDAHGVILDARRQAELQTRPLHSNDLLDGAFVFDDDEVTYNIGARYRGSPWGRPGKTNFRVRFPKDRRFHRGRTEINLSSRGSSPREGVAYFLAGRLGRPGKPAPTADYSYIRTFWNGTSLGTQARVQPVDGDYIDKWYDGRARDAVVVKAVGRLAFNDSCSRTGWDGASFWHMGDETENYRGYWVHSVHQTRDRWDELIELTRVMDRRVTPDAEFDEQVDDVLDVEAFLRMLAVRILTSDWDAVFVGNGHNGYLVLDPADGKWELLPFDMDNSMGNAGASLFPTGDTHVLRLLGRPAPRRTYFRILSEFVDGYWSSAAAGPWMDAVTSSTRVNASSLKGYIDTVAGRVRSTIRTATSVPLSFLSGEDGVLVTELDTVLLDGEAPVQVAHFMLEIDGGDVELVSPRWTSPTRWQMSFTGGAPEHELTLLGFDSMGELVDTATLIVRNTFAPEPPTLHTLIPARGSTAGGTNVILFGSGYTDGLRVFFGGVEAATVTIQTPEVVNVLLPPAPASLLAGGLADVELRIPGAEPVVAPEAFEYIADEIFVRGDVNADGDVNIGDPIATLLYLFAGETIACVDAADADDDGNVDISDPLRVLNYLFTGGEPPAAPFPDPGPDVTADELDC